MDRLCKRCGTLKSEDEFPPNRYGRTGYYRQHTCRECHNARRKDHAHDDKPEGLTCKKCGEYKPIAEFPQQRQALYGVELTCKACKRERRREYIRLHPERARNADLKYHYGMTIEDYNAMITRQDGKCAICGRAEQKLVVDHNHRTGKVRQLLCHLCNALIGCAREKTIIIANAIIYLQQEQQAESETPQPRDTSSSNI